MSRRTVNPAADRAAQNQQTIKTLLKLEANKGCADCKRNKHPRWASWNLGIFICIRCSGIHRGMGTHISRVKSVDLDAWTDEQLQSVIKWGNTRANKYWEAKLAPGHVPSDAKIENFIRTKYESKRWVMDGPMPNPSTLDEEGDDDVPLNVVREKAKLERSSSQRLSSASGQTHATIQKPQETMDIFGEITSPPARPSTTDTVGARPPPPKASAPPKAAKPADSLLGLDFLGGPAPEAAGKPARATTTPGTPSGQSRPDLKQSILSLYASAPKPQPAQEQTQQHQRQASFGGMQSPQSTTSSSNLGGLNDAFSGLGFSSPSSPPAPISQQQSKSGLLSSFSNPVKAQPQRSNPAPPQVTSPPLSGGSFFDTGPKAAPKIEASQPALSTQKANNILNTSDADFGDFSFASSPPEPSTKQPSKSASSGLFDMSRFASKISAPAKTTILANPTAPPPTTVSSPFNLSAQPTPAPKSTKATAPSTSSANTFNNISNSDVWGSDDAWGGGPESATPAAPPPQAKTTSATASGMDSMAWPSTTSTGIPLGGTSSLASPKVAQDEDFGGWSSAAPVAPSGPAQNTNTSTGTTSKPSGGGFGGGDDLFSNVWG